LLGVASPFVLPYIVVCFAKVREFDGSRGCSLELNFGVKVVMADPNLSGKIFIF
jgi:hypothetical protein